MGIYSTQALQAFSDLRRFIIAYETFAQLPGVSILYTEVLQKIVRYLKIET